MTSRWLDSAWLLGALALVLGVGLWVHGCEGTIGLCAGKDCPQLPGCEGAGGPACDENHVCLEQVCDGVGWICGISSDENYAWSRKSAPCDDEDPCTLGDVCVAGHCAGTPATCKSPPTSTCVDSSTVRSYASPGKCAAGVCSYSSIDVKCPSNDCVDGQCKSSPCTGVTCDNPTSTCYKSPGTCAAGKCTYQPHPSGTACTSTDACEKNPTCDGQGKCAGKALDCSRTHTTGGTCVSGVCQNYACESGWGNCNSDWSDGCETALTSTTNCGKCAAACGSVAHGSPSCSGGKCVAVCTSPYADCDQNYANGCEVPVGVANVCSESGLASSSGTTIPCGTAYCGKGTDTKLDFGSYHCVFCAHCHHYSDGYSWCLTTSNGGTGYFSTARCSTCCSSSSEDKVCK